MNSHTILKILIGILTLISLFSVYAVVTCVVEGNSRQQARYNLEQVKVCLDGVSAEQGMGKALTLCTKASRTSPTGDVYILDGDTKEFLAENSKDVPTKMFFTEDSIGQYFQDWESGYIAGLALLSGKDSNVGFGATYQYDDADEWLEWKNYVHEGKWYIIVQGTQSDEVISANNRILLMVWFMLLGITTVTFSITRSVYGK